MWCTKLQALVIDPGLLTVPMETLLVSEPAFACLQLSEDHCCSTLGTILTWQGQPGPWQTLTNAMSTSQLGTNYHPRCSPNAWLLKSSYTNHLLAIRCYYWKLLATLHWKDLGEEIQASCSQDIEFEKQNQKNQEKRNEISNLLFFFFK